MVTDLRPALTNPADRFLVGSFTRYGDLVSSHDDDEFAPGPHGISTGVPGVADGNFFDGCRSGSFDNCMALNSLLCADVPLSTYTLTLR